MIASWAFEVTEILTQKSSGEASQAQLATR